VIRFSAALVVVAIGILIGGVATSSLPLVYVAIGVSVLALAVLATGVALKKDELFGEDARSAASGTQAQAGQHDQPVAQVAQPGPAGWEVPAAAEGSVFSREDVFSGASRGQVPSAWGSSPGPAGPDNPWEQASGTGQPRGTEWAQGGSPRPGAWPSEPDFPSAPAAAAPSPGKTAPRRPSAPPTRADPVLPWADALPTRVDIGKVKPPEPVPSWLEDVDDEPAAPSARRPADVEPPAATQRVSTADVIPGPPPATGEESTDTITGEPVPDEADHGQAVSDLAIADESANAGEAATDAGPAADESLPVAKPLPDVESPSDVEPLPEASEPPTAEPLAADEPRPANDAMLAEESRPADEVALAEDEPVPEGGSPLVTGQPSEAEVLPEAAEPAEDEPVAEDTPPAADEASAGGKPVTVVPGVPRYHDQDCFLIEFLPADELRQMTVHEAEATGCTPCGACQPE
jgi:hypothetical protein